MITLAEILELRVDTNLCKVRVPILEPVGNTKQVTMWATMMLPPGIHAGYEVGDVVFVSFVDNSLNRPLVLGQLYRGNQGTAIDNIGKGSDKLDRASDFSCGNLDATGNVSLPASTTFKVLSGTKVTDTKTFQMLWQEVLALQTALATLQTNYNQLNSNYRAVATELSTLKAKVNSL
jgi:hypothetical protein